RQRLPHTGTSRHGAAGGRRARCPVPNACTPRLPCPGRTTSLLKHGAQHKAWQYLAPAAPGTGAVDPVHAPSAAQPARDSNSRAHATRAKAGEARPGAHRAVERTCRSLSLRELPSLWSQSAILLKRRACPLRVGDAAGSRVTSGVILALDAGAQ